MIYARKRRFPFRGGRRTVRKFRRGIGGSKRSRRFARRGGSYRRPVLYRRPSDVQPAGVYLKLHYFDNWTFTTGAGTIATNTFNANSIYDPDATGVGGLPSGYTEWSAMYNKYKVRGCRITCRFSNGALTAPQTICCIRARSNLDTAWATAVNLQQAFGELRKDHRGTILQNSAANTIGSTTLRSVTMYRSTRKVLGRDVNDQDLSASFGANPTTLWYYDVQICGVNATETGVQAAVSVWITYYVWLYQPAITASD